MLLSVFFLYEKTSQKCNPADAAVSFATRNVTRVPKRVAPFSPRKRPKRVSVTFGERWLFSEKKWVILRKRESVNA